MAPLRFQRPGLFSLVAVVAACASSQPASPTADAQANAVEFRTPAGVLKGTLHVPAGPGNAKHPTVILVHGSGPQSRDQAVPGQLNMTFGFTLPVFRQLAQLFVDRGYAVLRYDKRTCGPFNGCADNGYPAPGAGTTAYDFIDDVKAAIDFVTKQPSVDVTRIVVVGHSQGAMFVPRLMTDRPVIKTGVMIAGPHRTIDAIIADQHELTRRLLSEAGTPAATIDAQLAGLTKLVDDVRKLRAGEDLPGLVGGGSAAYWRSMFEIGDAAPNLARSLDRPVLVISGVYDWNVPPSETEAWRATLAKAADNLGHSVQVVPCVTHALNCVAQPDYKKIVPGDIGTVVHPPLVDRIAEFLDGAL